ncbi:MAG: hypothetical protein HKN20_10365 [Gemmatimonadetes bacterium]|nr:hypothetical protein [Gemmatimonadota bacterium]
MNTAIRAAGFAVYTGLAVVLLMEIFLRVFDPVGIAYYFETDRYFRAMQPNDAFAYIHAANDTSTYQGVRVVTNGEGLRSPAIERPKPAGRRRILLLGDSLVFGWGAPQDSLFAAHLQRAFSARGEDVEIIAAGTGSWNTRTEFEYLQARGLALEPDFVGLVILPNDVMPKRTGATTVPRDSLLAQNRRTGPTHPRWWKSLVRVSHVAATVQHIALQPDTRETLAAHYDENAPSWRDAKSALAQMAALTKQAGVPLLAFLYMTDDDSRYQAVFRERYESALRALQIPFAVLHRSETPDTRNSYVDRHPNARGHRALFDQIDPHLREFIHAPRTAQDSLERVR